MATTDVLFYGGEAVVISHHRDYRDQVFLIVQSGGALGARVVLSGSVDDLTALLARMAEQVDNADKAIMAAKSEPLPMDVSA